MSLNDKNEEEIQYEILCVNLLRAKNPHEEKLAREKIAKFRKEHPVLVDEIQSRRWTDYPGDPGY